MHPSQPVPTRRAARLWLCIAALAGLTATAYSNSGSDVFVGLNALRSVRDNPDIRQLWPLSRAMSLHLIGPAALGDGGTLVRRPVLSLSFALNRALLGETPRAYQAGNVVIHLLAGLVLFGILAQSSASLGFAFAVAALWLVHPLQTESVTYIPQRAEALAGLFLLLTVYCAARSFHGGGRPWQAVALLSCALGMATKEIVAAAPVLVWLYDAVLIDGSFRRPFEVRGRFYMALAATWLIFAGLMVATWSDASLDFQPDRIVPYALSQPTVILHYLKLAFWPHPLQLYVNSTQFWVDVSDLEWWRVLASTAVVTGLLTVSALALRRRHWIGLAGAWFFLILVPTSTVVATSDVIQEHRMYLSLAAPIAVAVAGAALILRRLLGSNVSARMGAAALLVAIAVGCGVLLTRARNLDYQSEFGAYASDDLPGAYGLIAHYEMVFRKDCKRASDLFRQMLSLRLPDKMTNYRQQQFHRVRVMNALGVCDALQGNFEPATAHFRQAIATDAEWAVARANDGVVTLMSDSIERAKVDLVAALAADAEMRGAQEGLKLIGRADGDAKAELATPASRQHAIKLWLSAPGNRIFDYILIPLLSRDYGG